MRTTLDIDDALHRRAKELAARTGRSLTSVIEDALQEALSREERRSGTRARLPVFTPSAGKRGTLPGVNLDDSEALRDLMDGAPA
ncbi:MAG TPA: type II toxin-antitoxin system VapB family antitoxin [Tepidiformaceae bacterium]